MSKNEESKPSSEENGEKSANEKKEIESIRSDVNKLSQELRTAVSDLKKSIVDIRSAVSEIENPFNLLRVVSSEKDLKRLESARLPSGVKSLILGKPEGSEKKEEVEEKPLASEVPLEDKELETKSPPIEEQKPSGSRLGPSGTLYLDWVWSFLDLGFSSDDIGQIAQSYELLGFLPEESSKQIYSLAVAAEKARSKGLTKGMFLLNMYEASVISGRQVSVDDLRRLISIAEKLLKEAEMAERVE